MSIENEAKFSVSEYFVRIYNNMEGELWIIYD